MTIRLFAFSGSPANVGRSSFSANGRNYSADANGVIDCPDFDANPGQGLGFLRTLPVLTTATRPTLGTDRAGFMAINTTTSAVEVWNGAAWKDVVSGAAA